MASRYSPALQEAIRKSMRPVITDGFDPIADLFDDINNRLDAGAVSITASGTDVDSIAKGGGSFAWDKSLSSLTFNYGSGRFHNGWTVVSVAAGFVTLASSATNYIECDRAGNVTANTTAFTAGRLPLYIVATGSSTLTTVTSAKGLLTLIGPAGVTGAMLSSAAAIKSQTVTVGAVAATKSIPIIGVGVAATLVAAVLINTTAVSTSDTDYWTFGIVNAASSALLNTGAANTTKATGGSAIAASTARILTLAASPTVIANDSLILTITKTGSPAALADLSLRLDFSFTA